MSENKIFQENRALNNARECDRNCDNCKSLCACAVCDNPTCDECVCAVCNAVCDNCECSICEQPTCVGCPSAPVKTLSEQRAAEADLEVEAVLEAIAEDQADQAVEGQVEIFDIAPEIELASEEAEAPAEEAVDEAVMVEEALAEDASVECEVYEDVEEVRLCDVDDSFVPAEVEAVVESDDAAEEPFEVEPVEEVTEELSFEESVQEQPVEDTEVVSEEATVVEDAEVVDVETVDEVPLTECEQVEEVALTECEQVEEVSLDVVEATVTEEEQIEEYAEKVEEAPVEAEVETPVEAVVEAPAVEDDAEEGEAEVSAEEEAMLNEEDEPEAPDPEEASKEERKRLVEEIMPLLAVPPRRRYIAAPSEKAFVDDEFTVEVLNRSEMKENVQSVFKALIKEGIKLGYLDKYDGLSASEIKEEYEGELVYEVADQELRKVALKVCEVKKETKVGVYAFSWDGTDVHHLGYLNEQEKAEALIPYIQNKDNYIFNVCGIITGGKFKSVEKDPKTEKIKIKNCEGLPYGIELDIAIYEKKQ